ncbi:hypothetical protein [Natranaerofaba carboxydovora]|uniref:hypothetical protein n=1 Tax=Natranaerofaba carboxydovora TaxID=2742683 RepID=UPI001F138F72|nr:hypothetical protein [Natranaerofaba carboxydovora]UMZ73433.1 hypothetical protein ACONDI_00987 [Natranaerofaba carboxydovora]
MKQPSAISLALEFVRVLFIFILGISLLFALETWFYNLINVSISEYAWMPGTANILLILVFYRNVLQFRGWFKSKQSKKLSKLHTKILLSIAFVLLILPVVIHYSPL